MHTESEEVGKVSEHYKDVLIESFGKNIAQFVRPELKRIPVNEITFISDRETYPIIQPVYHALLRYEIPTAYWVIIFGDILRCKTIHKNKVHIVYKQVFETLTGRVISEEAFHLLPAEGRQLWLEKYVEEPYTEVDTKRAAEHLQSCTKITQELAESCESKGVSLPGPNKAEYFEKVNFKELSRKQTLGRNTFSLREEIEEKSPTFHFDDKELAKLGEQSEVVSPSCPSESDQDEVEFEESVNETSVLGSDKNSTRTPAFNPAFKANLFQLQNKCKSPISKSLVDICETSLINNHKTSLINKRKTSNMANTSIRIIDFLPTKYNPSKIENDPESHILGFRDYLCAQLGVHNLDDVELSEQKLDMFKYTSLGEARLWYESNGPFANINELEENFLKEYAPDLQSRTTAAKALANLKFDRKTKICSFVNKIMRLNRTLNYNDGVLKDRFMAAMPNDIRRLARLYNPTFKESVKL